jgi:hypothetical protein
MAEVIRFKTRMFDLTKERPNPYNPIYGESLLLWLAQKTKGSLEITPPDAEDWGWYSCAVREGRSYMLGVCVYDEEDGLHEWVLQIDKKRSLLERVRGKEEMDSEDELLKLILSLLKNEPEFSDVSID